MSAPGRASRFVQAPLQSAAEQPKPVILQRCASPTSQPVISNGGPLPGSTQQLECRRAQTPIAFDCKRHDCLQASRPEGRVAVQLRSFSHRRSGAILGCSAVAVLAGARVPHSHIGMRPGTILQECDVKPRCLAVSPTPSGKPLLLVELRWPRTHEESTAAFAPTGSVGVFCNPHICKQLRALRSRPGQRRMARRAAEDSQCGRFGLAMWLGAQAARPGCAAECHPKAPFPRLRWLS